MVHHSLFQTFFLWWCWSVCVIKRAQTERLFHELDFISFAPQEDAEGTVWLNDKTTFWRWKRNARNSNQKVPAGIPDGRQRRGQLETLAPRLRAGNCAGLNETVWVCSWRNRHAIITHIVGHVYGGPVVRICRCTVHCFRCWACLPAAAGFRGAHWQH